MAKNKKRRKKKKNQPPRLSPERYIMAKARKLPIVKCTIGANWEEDRMTHVLVAREHVNGNKTFAFFLVDLNCLGIKDADYHFNMNDLEFTEFLEKLNFGGSMDCDYDLAHSVIYGALDYAERYGFSPAKEWEVAKYILEEDSEEIPKKDLVFGGKDGNPFYVSGPFDNKATQNRILQTLERTAGKGNYHFIISDGKEEYDEDDFDLDDEWDLDDFEERDEENIFDSESNKEEADFAEETIFDQEGLQDILSGKKEPTFHQTFLLTASFYRVRFPEDDIIDVEALHEGLKIDEENQFHPQYPFDIENLQMEEFLELSEEEANEKTVEEILEKLDRFLDENPDNPSVLTFYFNVVAHYAGEIREDIVHKMRENFPDFLNFRFEHAKLLSLNGEFEKAWKELGSELSLGKAFPERKGAFFWGELLNFDLAMCVYFTQKGELGKAINYAGEALLLDDEDQEAQMNILVLLKAMQKKLGE